MSWPENLWRSVGLVISIIILTLMSYYISICDRITRLVVRINECVYGVVIDRDNIPWNLQRFHNNRVKYEIENDVIDEKDSLKDTDFSQYFSPEQLIEKTKTFVSKEVMFGSGRPEVLAEDFQFIFPVVGPLKKEEFVKIFSSFKLEDAFPDTKQNFFGFTVDPLEPNRVWYFSRAVLKHEGTLRIGGLVIPPTHKTVVAVPQALSVSFDTEGLVYKFTGGYATDKTVGNTGGLGGVFGIIYAIGGSFPVGPEAKPWKPSLQWEASAKRLGQLQKEWKKQ